MTASVSATVWFRTQQQHCAPEMDPLNQEFSSGLRTHPANPYTRSDHILTLPETGPGDTDCPGIISDGAHVHSQTRTSLENCRVTLIRPLKDQGTGMRNFLGRTSTLVNFIAHLTSLLAVANNSTVQASNRNLP